MGKKGAGSSGKGAKSAQEEAPPENGEMCIIISLLQDDSTILYFVSSEGLKLTGVLSTDLALLCEQEGLPPISVRPLVSRYASHSCTVPRVLNTVIDGSHV